MSGPATERRVLAALRRLHRASPLTDGFRVDAVARAVRSEAAADRRPAGHRGASRPPSDAELQAALDELVARGEVVRSGRRVWLQQRQPIAAEMSARVAQLLGELREAGASPPRVEPLARRLGIPPATLAQLRESHQLVRLAPGIEYPSDVADALRSRVAGLGSASVGQLAAELGVTRRYADALLKDRDRRGVG